MAAPRNSTRANFTEFKGLHNARGLDGVPFGGFAESENTDIDRDGKPQRRRGRTKVYSGAVLDTWGDGELLLFVTATGELRRLHVDASTEVLRSGLPAIGRLCAVRNAHDTYWSFGTAQGVISDGADRSFGLDQLTPAGVVVNSGSSQLAAGVYRYAWCIVTADGEEGPIGLRGVFELTERGGVDLVPPIPSDVRATRVRAYVTEPNGTQLYRLATVDAPTDAGEQAARHVTVVSVLQAVRPSRENRHALPAFTAAGLYNGRLLVAYGDLLIYSDRFDYEYFAPDEMFIPFFSAVRIIAPVDDGVFVGTDTDHFFLDGADIASATLRRKASYGAIAHTVDYLEKSEHGFEAEQVAVWMGKRGPVFGLPGGQMQDTGDGIVAVPSNIVHGAGGVRKHAGDMHYVSVVRYRGTE